MASMGGDFWPVPNVTHLQTHQGRHTARRTHIPVTSQYIQTIAAMAQPGDFQGYFLNSHPDQNPPGYALYISKGSFGYGPRAECETSYYLPAHLEDDGRIVRLEHHGTAIELLVCPRDEWRSRGVAPRGGRRAA